MIYLAGIALISMVFGFIRKARRKGFRTTVLDSFFAALAGLAAGVFIGFGARIGMAAIAFFNGDVSRFSVAGSFQVILLFSSFGIGLGLFYSLLLRDLLRRSSLLFGAIITIFTWYPFAESAVEVMRFQPTFISLVFFSGIFTAFIWLPFAFALEKFLVFWENRKSALSGWFCKHGRTTS